jgi:hypothetical protein
MKKIILLLFICITVFLSSCSCSKPSASIYYKVTADNAQINVTYTTSNGQYSGVQTAPFTSETYTFKSGQTVSITVQNYMYLSGKFNIEIYKNGSPWQSGSGSNTDIITVSGTI